MIVAWLASACSQKWTLETGDQHGSQQIDEGLNTPMNVLRALILALVVLVPSAFAGGTSHKAEGVRLVQEMNKLAARSAWLGVGRSYEQLVALPGVPIDIETHLLAAEASRNQGDITETWHRLQRVLLLDGLHPEAHLQIATIAATYGEVTLTVHKKWTGEVSLTGIDLGFSPEYRIVFERAQQMLDAERIYHGLLPLGRYQLAFQHFEIIGGPPVHVTLK